MSVDDSCDESCIGDADAVVVRPVAGFDARHSGDAVLYRRLNRLLELETACERFVLFGLTELISGGCTHKLLSVNNCAFGLFLQLSVRP